MCWSVFLIKLQDWRQNRCFPVKISKFLRMFFFTEHLGWLLLLRFPSGASLCKVNNGSMRTMCETCLKSTIKTPVTSTTSFWCLFFLTLNRSHTLLICFHYWPWASKLAGQVVVWLQVYSPTNIYLSKVSYKNTRQRFKMCSKLTIKALEQRQWIHSGVFIVKFT